MRLHEIQDVEVDYAKLTKAFADISKRCRQIVSLYKTHLEGPNNFFYHGTRKHGTAPVYRARSVSNRGPKDTSVEVHDKLVELMSGLGLTAHRGNSLFMSSDFNNVHEEYGRPFIVFPVDGFKYTWSPRVKDVFAEMERTYQLNQTIANLDPDSLNDIKWFEQHYAFQDSNLAGALQSGHEVMVAGEYYAVNSMYIEYVKQLVLRESI